MFFTEHNRILNSKPPSACSGAQGALLSGDYVKMENYDHITMVCSLGDCTSASRILIEEDANGSGLGTRIGFTYATLASGTSSSLGTPTTAASTGLALAEATYDGYQIFVELDAADLTPGYPWVRMVVGCSGDGATFTNAGIHYILSRGRHAAKGAIT